MQKGRIRPQNPTGLRLPQQPRRPVFVLRQKGPGKTERGLSSPGRSITSWLLPRLEVFQ